MVPSILDISLKYLDAYLDCKIAKIINLMFKKNVEFEQDKKVYGVN